MSRIRTFIIPVALIGAVGFVAVWRNLYEAAWSPRQIILITVDGLRADRLGAYGYTARPLSPNIDALAAQSVVFERAFDAPPATAASRSAGAPAEIGVGGDGDALSSGIATLAELFHQRGIATAAFAVPAEAIAEPDGTAGPDQIEPAAAAAQRARPLLEWLHAHAGESFFVWTHAIEPSAASAPADDADMAGWSAADITAHRADALVGAIMHTLATLKMGNELMVVLTAGPFAAGGDTAAQAGGEVASDDRRVPLLFATPVFAPAHVDAPVQLTDVFPTIAGLAALPAPPDSHGTSLVPLLRAQ